MDDAALIAIIGDPRVEVHAAMEGDAAIPSIVTVTLKFQLED